jgi:hypothetical protein
VLNLQVFILFFRAQILVGFLAGWIALILWMFADVPDIWFEDDDDADAQLLPQPQPHLVAQGHQAAPAGGAPNAPPIPRLRRHHHHHEHNHGHDHDGDDGDDDDGNHGFAAPEYVRVIRAMLRLAGMYAKAVFVCTLDLVIVPIAVGWAIDAATLGLFTDAPVNASSSSLSSSSSVVLNSSAAAVSALSSAPSLSAAPPSLYASSSRAAYILSAPHPLRIFSARAFAFALTHWGLGFAFLFLLLKFASGLRRQIHAHVLARFMRFPDEAPPHAMGRELLHTPLTKQLRKLGVHVTALAIAVTVSVAVPVLVGLKISRQFPGNIGDVSAADVSGMSGIGGLAHVTLGADNITAAFNASNGTLGVAADALEPILTAAASTAGDHARGNGDDAWFGSSSFLASFFSSSFSANDIRSLFALPLRVRFADFSGFIAPVVLAHVLFALVVQLGALRSLFRYAFRWKHY